MDPERTRRFLKQLSERRRSLADEVEDDVAPYRDMTPDQRGKVLEAVCRSAWEVTVSRTDRDEVLAHQDPLPPAAADIWLRLVREYRRAKAAERTWTMPRK